MKPNDRIGPISIRRILWYAIQSSTFYIEVVPCPLIVSAESEFSAAAGRYLKVESFLCIGISSGVIFNYDPLMFCPKCKAEYRAGFTECSDCGERLVERLDASVPTNRPRKTGGPELLWSGTDAGMSELIVGALDEAGIPHHSQTREVGLLPGLSQPAVAIFIPGIHHDAAHAALEAARRESESGAQVGAQTSDGASPTSEDDSEAASDEIGGGAGSYDLAEDTAAGNYDPDQATAEVWSGDDVDTKDMLIASLRENGIESEVDSDGKFQIRVMASAEARAREIVREVIEATPPQ